MKYVRKWKCAMCGDAVIIDTAKKTQSCNCSTTKRNASGSIAMYIFSDDFEKNYELLCI